MNRYYYTDQFKTDGNVLGPVSIEELEQLYINQEITEKCLVCIEGSEEWESFIEVLTQFNEQKRDLKKQERGKKEKKLKAGNTSGKHNRGVSCGKLIYLALMVIIRLLQVGAWLLIIYGMIIALQVLFH